MIIPCDSTLQSPPTKQISIATAQAYIEKLDLSYIIEYMTSDRYPLPRWTLADAKHCVQLYKNFLFLIRKNEGEFLVPTRNIDEVWHNHILYTKNYLHDCMNIFGHYLHHDPEMPGDDPQKLIENYKKTKALYFKEFNQPLNVLDR